MSALGSGLSVVLEISVSEKRGSFFTLVIVNVSKKYL